LSDVVDAATVGAVGVASVSLVTVKVKALVVAIAPLASVTRTVTVCVEAADGVPRITPVELSIAKPEGRVPEATANV
jgi:hypothetical protein